MDYREIFTFALTQPVLKAKDCSFAKLLDLLYADQVIPLVYITDKTHPAFVSVLKNLPEEMIDDYDTLILSYTPLKPYFA